MTRSRDPGTFHTTLDPNPASAAMSRQDFAVWLVSLGLEGDPLEEMAVVYSELVANAARAAAGAATGPVVYAWQAQDELILEVANPVPGADAPATGRWDVQDPLRSGGRGLMIARAYSDDFCFDATDGYVRVRCRRRLGTPADQSPAPA